MGSGEEKSSGGGNERVVVIVVVVVGLVSVRDIHSAHGILLVVFVEGGLVYRTARER